VQLRHQIKLEHRSRPLRASVRAFYWSWTSLQCELNCSLVTNSTGTRVSQAECECILSNYWDLTVGSCISNCSSMPHGVYSWEYKTCVPNCSSIRNTNGTVYKKRSGWYVCPCAAGLPWNNVTMECDGAAPTCPTRSHLNTSTSQCDCDSGNPTPPNQFNLIKDASQNCVCPGNPIRNSTFQTSAVYDATAKYCQCPPTNPNTIDSTTQIALVWNGGSNWCECPNVATLEDPTIQSKTIFDT
jgi:hypothetical protein